MPEPSHDIEAALTSVLGSLSRAAMEAEYQKTLDELGKKKRVTPSIMTDVTPLTEALKAELLGFLDGQGGLRIPGK